MFKFLGILRKDRDFLSLHRVSRTEILSLFSLGLSMVEEDGFRDEEIRGLVPATHGCLARNLEGY